MENEDFITSKGNSSKDFGDIVLKQIRRVLKIASEEKSKEKYCSSVEALAHILMPYFDKDAKTKYEEFNCIMNESKGSKKLYEKFKEDAIAFKKAISKDYSEDSHEYTEYMRAFWKEKEFQCAKELFCELNLLLKRVDYLKGSVYGEGLNEGEDDEDDEEEKEEE